MCPIYPLMPAFLNGTPENWTRQLERTANTNCSAPKRESLAS